MKVLVLDSGRKQAASIRESFSKRKIDAVVCSTSNEFLAALNAHNFESAYINAEAWARGRCIYDYFGAGRKLEGKPAVIYNADEKFTHISGRKPDERDRVLPQPSDIETALSAA